MAVRVFASVVSRRSACGAGGRQEAELAGDVAAVDVGGVGDDQVVDDLEHVAALDRDPLAVGGEALEAARGRRTSRSRASARSSASRCVVVSISSKVKSGNASNSSAK